ncbi:glycosyltransferase family 4 protein [Pseudooceanicola sp. MF1-13]|uniref:glycosyltransferase family 4 protein n=1 Tax=Pseudooceanicola sp. MF1-13 TaxID=3379095 RepID=UPI0038916F64
MPELFVTNFNRNFTGVSGTAAGVVRHQARQFDMCLVGHPLPGAPEPISRALAKSLSRTPPQGKPFAIWHVRRDPEMMTAIWARDVLRLPIRIVFTSAAQRYHSWFPRWLISRMDAVIATTDRAADFVPHVRAVVPHGVDTDRFRPVADGAKTWAQTGYPGQRGIATIGRIRPEKGTDVFVDTALRVLPDHPDTTALIIGKTKSKDAAFLQGLKDKIAAAGLSDRILFVGELGPDALADLLPQLDLVMQLPRYEGYGLAPLEAMSCGVPLLASDAGYFREFTAQGAGEIVPLDDAEAAAQNLSALLSDSARLATMGSTARQDATTRFSIHNEVAGINAVYDQLWTAT